MSLESTVLLCRRVFSSEYTLQSIIGIAFPGQTYWLFSPSDQNAVTAGSVTYQTDPAGVTVEVNLFYCFVGQVLKVCFPEMEQFQIFRLHFDSYKYYRDQQVAGNPTMRWLSLDRSGYKQYRLAGMESLWGNPYAPFEQMVDDLRTGIWTRHIFRPPQPLAESLSFLADRDNSSFLHPDMEPLFPDEESQLIFQVEQKLGKGRALKERIN